MMKIKQFFAKKELKLRKKRLILMSCCIVAVIAGYVIITWPKKKAPEIPVVSVEKVGVEDVKIYGDYVGRIRAHQFVEVRARVEGFLEKMAFAEGTYVKKDRYSSLLTSASIRQK